MMSNEVYRLIEQGVDVPVMSYPDALGECLRLARAGQIDEVDVAFGDEGLEEQRLWQISAIQTVEGFLEASGGSLLGLDYAETSGGDYPTPIAAERDMDPGDPLDAMRIVIDIAEGVVGTMTPDEEMLAAQSIATTRDLVGMHGPLVAHGRAATSAPRPSF